MRISRDLTATFAGVVGIAMLLASLQSLTASPNASGPPPPEYVHFIGHSQAALYRPDPEEYPDPTIGVLHVHRTGNHMNSIENQELTARGFISLGLNTHAANNEAAVRHDELIPIDVRAGVDYLYDEVGVDKVVLLGGSGGGPTVTYYQAIAEKGLAVCQGSEKIVECPDDVRLVGRPADAVILRDAHPGLTTNRLRSLNPAVRSEASPERVDASLNPYLERNGYNPNGCSSYSEDFKQRYFEAQANRMNRLIDDAQEIRTAIDAGNHFPTGDDSFVVHRARARLVQIDNTIHARTLGSQKLLKDDRDIVTDIVNTVRTCSPQNKDVDAAYSGGTLDLTVRSFLGVNAIRSSNSMFGVDYCSSNNSTQCMVQYIEVPTLAVAAQGHYFMRDNEEIMELSASVRPDFVVVEGATHGMGNCGACDGAPYFNVRENYFDYIAEWMNTDFTPIAEMP
jgi:hypothetical protein